MSEPDDVSRGLPATSWAVLGMLTFGEELTGNDLKKWADWSVGFFYWSPSISQVYAELKKLESIGFVESRVVSEPGVRGKRLYSITQSGTDAVRTWSREAPVEVPVLKHGVMLRLWMGHLNEPERLKRWWKPTSPMSKSRFDARNSTQIMPRTSRPGRSRS